MSKDQVTIVEDKLLTELGTATGKAMGWFSITIPMAIAQDEHGIIIRNQVAIMNTLAYLILRGSK